MQKIILSSKIHRACVTDSSLEYEGSLGIDSELMAACGLSPFEKILVGNLDNGNRFETYAIESPSGSKAIVLNGAAAHLGKVGDRLTIMSFVSLEPSEIEGHVPQVIVLNEKNEVINRRGK